MGDTLTRDAYLDMLKKHDGNIANRHVEHERIVEMLGDLAAKLDRKVFSFELDGGYEAKLTTLPSVADLLTDDNGDVSVKMKGGAGLAVRNPQTGEAFYKEFEEAYDLVDDADEAALKKVAQRLFTRDPYDFNSVRMAKSQVAKLANHTIASPLGMVAKDGTFRVNQSEDISDTDPLFKRSYLRGHEEMSILIAQRLKGSEVQTFKSSISMSNLINKSLLSGLGVPDSDILNFHWQYTEKRKAIAQEMGEWMLEVSDKRLLDNGVDVDKYPHYSTKQFIATADDDNAVKYRAEFVDNTFRMMFGDDVDEVMSKLSDNAVSRLLSDTLFGANRGRDAFGSYHSTIILETIDKGAYPYSQIASAVGMPGLSKKEFFHAMSMRANYILGKSSENQMPETRDLWVTMDVKSAFALSKVPQSWLLDKDGDYLFINEAIRKMGKADASLVESFFPFLVGLGEDIDKLKVRGDKKEAKQLASKWSWLSKGQGDALTKMRDIDEKYKMKASLTDYAAIMAGLVEAVHYNVVYTNDKLEGDDLAYEDGSSIELNYETINQQLKSAMIESAENSFDPADFDDEDEEYRMDEQEYIQHEIENVEVEFNVPYGEPSTMILREQMSKTPVKDMLEMNSEMHKRYSKFTVLANKSSTVGDLHWKGLLAKGNIKLGDYELVNVDSRVELMREGDVQDHCVFNYLKDCCAGESSILSLRDPNGGEHDIVSTIELADKSHDDDVLDLEIEQHYGYDNAKVDFKTEGLLVGFVAGLNAAQINAEEQDIGEMLENITVKLVGTMSLHFNDELSAYEVYSSGLNMGSVTLQDIPSGEVTAQYHWVSASAEQQHAFESKVNATLVGYSVGFAADVVDFKQQSIDLSEIQEIDIDPLENGEVTKAIPYKGDGAHLAYFFANEYLPEGLTIDQFIRDGEKGEYIYHASAFPDNIKKIQTIGKELGLTPYNVVKCKIENKIDTYANTKQYIIDGRVRAGIVNTCLSVHQEPLDAAKAISDLLKEKLSEQCPPEIVLNAISNGLDVLSVMDDVRGGRLNIESDVTAKILPLIQVTTENEVERQYAQPRLNR